MLAIFGLYQSLTLPLLVAGLWSGPNYVRRYPAWENARRTVQLTPSVADTVVLIAREPLLEYGRRHSVYGVAVWSFELTWSSLLFSVSSAALVGIYLAIGPPPARWATVGSLGAAG